MRKSKTLRLHRQHDLDLITLYRVSGFSFSKEVRNILVAYVNREPYDPPEIDYEDVDLSYLPTTIQYHLTLDPSDPREQAVLDMLHDEIKYGYVNSFIKALVRAYIPRIPLIGYGVANGFVTRHITANDVGMRIREAQKTEQKQVKAESLTVEDLVPGIDEVPAVDPKETVSTTDDVQNAIEQKEPKSIGLSYTEPEHMESFRTTQEETQSDVEDDSDDDSFDDFFKEAQAFTGV